MAQMASNRKFDSGQFTGDRTTLAQFNVGFEPDVIIVKARDLDPLTAGWTGNYLICIIKNTLTIATRHNNNNVTALNTSVDARVGGDYPPYGTNVANSSGYTAYGTYADGVFSINNVTNNGLTRFINGEVYVWEAYAK